ncbi:MAG: type IV pilus twitching motility protein PilT [Acidobacteriota bacterium]
MDQFEQLLSKFRELGASELHLDANQKPYYLTPGGVLEISAAPIQHKDIVQLLSPVLPVSVKSELMEKPNVEFPYQSRFGAFLIGIRKTTIGFNVLIRATASPVVVQTQPMAQIAAQPTIAPAIPAGAAVPVPIVAPAIAAIPSTAPAVTTASASSAATTFRTDGADAHEIDALFYKMTQMGASDLHISVGMSPMVRHDGEMRSLEGYSQLQPEDTERLLYAIMPKRNQEEFNRRHDTDFAYEIPGLARFRSNIFMDRKGVGAVFRVIPTKILTAEQLKLSKSILDLCFLSKGLVVVTGPTGSGKSTTLAAMVDYVNRNRKDHIITIEDPIEFVHDNKGCLINQREVHTHTDSFKDALRAALREDPDIILVGEMRDLETVAIAIETAETGHLVFGTLHTTTAASTVDRLIDQFPTDQQAQIRTMLSESLKGVIAQTLLKKKGGGRVAALEVLLVTPAIANLIREGKTFQIPSVIQTAKNIGMVTLNDALMEHVKNNLVSPEDAYVKAVDKVGFKELCKRNEIPLSF